MQVAAVQSAGAQFETRYISKKCDITQAILQECGSHRIPRLTNHRKSAQAYFKAHTCGTMIVCELAAALLIQGSACVYSKKVEYLHSLVFRALDCINQKR
jgi:hypothetical protein